MKHISSINETLSNFITADGLHAMTLSGEWGTGKTYAVRAYLGSATAKGELEASGLQYAYVSLFGISNIAILRQRICAAVIDGYSSIKQVSARALANAKHLIPVVKYKGVEVKLDSLGGVASAVTERTILKRLLVVIDDLERSQIQFRELLGLLAELTEQCDCKCIVILNSEKLVADQIREFNLQFEKIFDLHVSYAPSIESNLKIGFLNENERVCVSGVFRAFGNSNVRIMRRARWAISCLQSHIKNDIVLEKTIYSHTAVIALLKYAYSDKIEDLKKTLEKPSYMDAIFGRSTNSNFPNGVGEILDKIYFRTLPIDSEIIDLFDQGAINSVSIAAAIDKTKRMIDESGQEALHQQIWEQLNTELVEDAAAFEQQILKFLGGSFDSIIGYEIFKMCNLLLTINDSAENRKCVKKVLKLRLENSNQDNRETIINKFPKLAKIVAKTKYKPVKSRQTIEQVMLSLEDPQLLLGSNPLEALSAFKDKEIKAYLVHTSTETLTRIKRLLRGVPASEAKLSKRVKSILDDIAVGNAVKRYQIKDILKHIPSQSS